MFDKILIANRGEIACRIIATCRRLGVATVAIYSEADAQALHVRRADEARCIGGAAARESYLNGARVIEAARASAAQAIHPGYGFLSENPQFAELTAAAGLVFVGPPLAAMRAMSSKATARELMQRAGVPVLRGYQGTQQDGARLRHEAERIGYPVLIKAASGGGGKGMRMVEAASGFDTALAACQREAAASFGDPTVVLEKFLAQPRHIEVQVFGDAAGNIVHLYERDCSAQRRHQKVLEESPAPLLTEREREALTRSACDAARAVGYASAGTIEFLLDTDRNFYFIEMNTRIQVEHAVTEMITGTDLIEWQLRVAAGESLPLSQESITRSGHAIEARLYAEVPEAGFLPSSGNLQRFELPAASSTLRLETGIEAGDTVGVHYDPMLAKLIAHGDTRAEALSTLQTALAQVRVSGVGNNLLFLRRLISNATFRAGSIDTGFIERELPQLISSYPAALAPDTRSLILAAAGLWLLERERQALPAAASSPWERSDGWRLNGVLTRTLLLELGPPALAAAAAARTSAAGAQPAPTREALGIEYRAQGPWLSTGEHAGAASLHALGHDLFEVRFAGRAQRVQMMQDAGGALQLALGLDQYRVQPHDPLRVAATTQLAEKSLAAPMPGRIIAQLVRVGEAVRKGTPLLILEAMKMEHTICAPADGTLRGYRAGVGAQIQEGAELVEFEIKA